MQLTKSYLLNKINGNKMGKNVLDKIFREHILESMHLQCCNMYNKILTEIIIMKITMVYKSIKIEKLVLIIRCSLYGQIPTQSLNERQKKLIKTFSKYLNC